MRVVKLEHRVRVELPRIAEVPLLRVRIPVVRIHDASSVSVGELSRRWWDSRQRIYSKSPVNTQNPSARSRHYVTRA